MTQDIGFNLDNFDVAQDASTFLVGVILDADGEDKSGFMIVGKNSPQYQQAAQVIRASSLKRSSKRKTALDTSTDDGATAVAAIIDANEVTLACSVVIDWFGFASGGVPANFDKELLLKMLKRFPTWREKISAALEVDANFMKG